MLETISSFCFFHNLICSISCQPSLPKCDHLSFWSFPRHSWRIPATLRTSRTARACPTGTACTSWWWPCPRWVTETSPAWPRSAGASRSSSSSSAWWVWSSLESMILKEDHVWILGLRVLSKCSAEFAWAGLALVTDSDLWAALASVKTHLPNFRRREVESWVSKLFETFFYQNNNDLPPTFRHFLLAVFRKL